MAGGDGRLTHDLIPGEKGPQDACGVFGVWAPGEEVAKLTYFGLYALQHRGQESAGHRHQRRLAASWSTRTWAWSPRSSTSAALSSLQGPPRGRALPLLHDRRLAPGRTPSRRSAATTGGTVALAHNGNLTNSAELRDLARRPQRRGLLRPPGGELRRGNTTDTALVDGAARPTTPTARLEAAALDVLPQLRGAFCFVFMDEHTLYAARDPQGIRPLVLGRLERGWVVACETAALDIVGASLVREVEPGELIAIDDDGLRTQRFAEPEPKGCVFEYVYLARPDTTISGRGVHEARVEMGRRLAARAPGRGRPGHPDARVGHAGRDRLRAGVRHPLRAGPGQELLRRAHLHRAVARPSASSASGSSSTRSRTSSAASGWSSSTTRSCAATPSAPWSGCCARPARPRCTCASPPRRCAGPASTASTSPPGPS